MNTTLLEKVVDFITSIPQRAKEARCRFHKFMPIGFTAEVFTVEKFERCSGAAICIKCGSEAIIYIPANKSEAESALPNQPKGKTLPK